MNKLRIGIFWLIVLGAAVAYSISASQARSREVIPYSVFLTALEEGRVEKALVEPQRILAEVVEDGQPVKRRVERIPGIDDRELLSRLEAAKVEFSGDMQGDVIWTTIASWMIPILLFGGMYFYIFRRFSAAAKGPSGPLSFGQNKARIYDESKNIKVSFDDVAGIDEAVDEVRELVDFLRNPTKYTALGAQIPKGVLLVGGPGTGKTLLAKAVAAEAQVPFFSMSGSDFVEMFVGVGAARVRDLFKQAMARSPCIVFIDEIDAIGKSRGGIGAIGTHDEREQTLNQLLAEMDGFDPRAGVVIMAATNRPEVLDPALVRSGRFDRQVIIDRPSLIGRKAILEVHIKGAVIGPTVDLDVLARRTPGMVGADLAKVVNEAALSAVRRTSTTIEQVDFEEAIDRIQLGLEKHGRVMTDEEKRRVAYHEAGHAIVAASVEHADPVHRVSIIPRSIGALGVTLQLPTEDRYLVLQAELLDQICVMMGGRVAEELIFSDVSTGAQNDLKRATETARQMVCKFGMSRLGLRTFGDDGVGRFLVTQPGYEAPRNVSEKTAEAIDREINSILDVAHTRAQDILREKEHTVRAVADRLLEVETLTGEELLSIQATADVPSSGVKGAAARAETTSPRQ